MSTKQTNESSMEVVYKTEEEIQVKFNNVEHSFMVALRRNCLWEVDCMTIENLEIRFNSSDMDDKKLAHRLGQIPFTSQDSGKYNYRIDCCKGECPRCAIVYTLRVKNVDKYSIRNITSLDLKPDDQDTPIRPTGGPACPPSPPRLEQSNEKGDDEKGDDDEKGGEKGGDDEKGGEKGGDDDEKNGDKTGNDEKKQKTKKKIPTMEEFIQQKYPDIPEEELKYGNRSTGTSHFNSLSSSSFPSSSLSSSSLSSSTLPKTFGVGVKGGTQGPLAGPPVFVCSLKPGQELDIRVLVRRGNAKDEDHHKYQASTLVGLKYPAIIKLDQEKIKKLTSGQKKEIVRACVDNTFKYDEVNDIFETTEDPDDSRKCNHSDKPMELVASFGQPDAIKIFPKFDYFLITVGTNGCLRPEEILLRAMEKHLDNLTKIHTNLAFSKGGYQFHEPL
jgi:DNA-directed RNA polymerase subunit L